MRSRRLGAIAAFYAATPHPSIKAHLKALLSTVSISYKLILSHTGAARSQWPLNSFFDTHLSSHLKCSFAIYGSFLLPLSIISQVAINLDFN